MIQHAVGLGHGFIERPVDHPLHDAPLRLGRRRRAEIDDALVQRALHLFQRDVGGWSRQLPTATPPLA